MTAYPMLALWFAGGAAVAATVLWAPARERPRGGAVVATALVLLALTAVFDNLMIAAGLFHYEEQHLLGVRIGLAPIEDLAYPLAGALLLPAVWSRLRGRRKPEGDPS
ncbi:lycopene cyclase domain-containing protein [Microbacterium hydrocarbonoxydans]|uniref:lycopene cyclase domain-containing protein n=1 Tax=Microbacterium hydrocarbonoxydans TaxID=273678 RepID=UPI0007BBAF49|nr:lycopene cyclase domain-containing protein [Microbacterium hydrocarbonoxydans]GAT73985.1 putative prenyltransferase, UbiA superfamily [Microbacterium sp. HM58-2]